jgi:hypothetical protein
MGTRVRRLLSISGAVCCVCAPAAARADDWFPHPPGAQWTWSWIDPTYNPNGTTESATIASESASTGCGWQLSWTGDTQIPLGGTTGGPVIDAPDDGTVCFSDESNGLTNTDWSGDPPPINQPPLCAQSNQCAGSLGSTMYNVIWASRAPVLAEPVLSGDVWTAAGGDGNMATSTNEYLGTQRIVVPAFPNGVTAAEVRSSISLTAAAKAGNTFGSGTRTTWWVFGVGPVQIDFHHGDGSITTAQLMSTSLTPQAPPPDVNYFPLESGLTSTYKWTNAMHLRRPEIEKVSVTGAVNHTARVLAQSVSGQLGAEGSYDFALRLSGLSTTSVATSASSLVKLPKLGRNLHFFTPIDLMTYGFNPVLPAYPEPTTTWGSGDTRDFHVYGVHGTTRIIGFQQVRVPAGTFRALEVQSILTQAGHPFGSGIRTMWFAPGRGLVKLVFKHRDGSTSLVQLIRCGPRHC